MEEGASRGRQVTRVSDSLNAAFDVQLRVRGVTVTVTRGYSTATITAIPAGATDQAMLMRGVLTEIAGRSDFLCRASDYELDGEACNPERGDVISWTDEGETSYFRVLPTELNQPHFSTMDPNGYALRIHTKQVAEP